MSVLPGTAEEEHADAVNAEAGTAPTAHDSNDNTAVPGQSDTEEAAADHTPQKAQKQKQRAVKRVCDSLAQTLLKNERHANGNSSQLTAACGGISAFLAPWGKMRTTATSKVDGPFTCSGFFEWFLEEADPCGWTSDGGRNDPSLQHVLNAFLTAVVGQASQHPDLAPMSGMYMTDFSQLLSACKAACCIHHTSGCLAGSPEELMDTLPKRVLKTLVMTLATKRAILAGKGKKKEHQLTLVFLLLRGQLRYLSLATQSRPSAISSCCSLAS